jgi:cold shock CspA family protein
LLDNALHFAALTHAQAGFGKLRPQRSAPKSLNKDRAGDAPWRRGIAPARDIAFGGGRNSSTAKGDQVSVTGKVKFYNEAKGYGFLTQDGGADVFVHRTDLPAEIAFLYEGQAVRFEIETTRRGLRAINIALV